MPDRVIVYLDYQNVYKTAREMFHGPDAFYTAGQVDPARLGALLVERSPFDRILAGVKVYRGVPDSTRQPRAYAANQRQIARWKRQPGVEPFTRPLQYPPDYPRGKPREKGIDVMLAAHYISDVERHACDVAILMSTDTDLKPALESAVEIGGVRIEVAAWTNKHRRGRRLSIGTRRLWCHWLDEDAYRAVHDPRDYSIP